MIDAVDFGIRLCLGILYGCRIVRADLPARLFECSIERLETFLRIRDDLHGVHLVRVEARDVDVEILHLGVLIEPL